MQYKTNIKTDQYKIKTNLVNIKQVNIKNKAHNQEGENSIKAWENIYLIQKT